MITVLINTSIEYILNKFGTCLSCCLFLSLKLILDNIISTKHNLVQTQKRKFTNNKKEQCMDMIKREEYEYTPKQGFVLTHFQTVQDVKRSAEFYLRIFGGKVIRSGEPTIIQIANSWLVLNIGGGPTDDK